METRRAKNVLNGGGQGKMLALKKAGRLGLKNSIKLQDRRHKCPDDDSDKLNGCISCVFCLRYAAVASMEKVQIAEMQWLLRSK